MSVKFNIQAYTKYISYSSSWSTDKESKFYLDNDLHDLSVSENGATTKQDVSKTYDPATKQIKIKSEGGRVFVHSMEIKYKKNSA